MHANILDDQQGKPQPDTLRQLPHLTSLMTETNQEPKKEYSPQQRAILCLNRFPSHDQQENYEGKNYCMMSRETNYFECPALSKDAAILPDGDGHTGLYRRCLRDDEPTI